MNYNQWEQGKLKHQELGNNAADDYDEQHHTTFGTGQYMRFEQNELLKYIALLPKTKSAIDLGSGTGRNSFLLSCHFDSVHGYDFSSNSVRVAQKYADKNNVLNTKFTVHDVDHEGLPHANNSIDFVCASFGMGSFIFSLGFLLSEIQRVLSPGGTFLLSFYNKNSLGYMVKDHIAVKPSFAAQLDPSNDLLMVTYNENKYKFPVRAYTAQQIRASVNNFMEVVDIYTYPLLPTILDDSILNDSKSDELIEGIDKYMSDVSRCDLGAYILALGRKPTDSLREPHGYNRSYETIRRYELQDQVLLHDPVLVSSDALILNVSDSTFVSQNMIKTIIVATEATDELRLFAVCLRIEDKLDMKMLSSLLEVPRSALRFATPKEIYSRLGFRPGAIPPFSLSQEMKVYADTSISLLSTIWCGTGSPIESVKLNINTFKSTTNAKFSRLSRGLR